MTKRLHAGRGGLAITGGKGPWVLRLYVAGQTGTSKRALANLKQICAQRLAGRWQIEVIDLWQQPELARQDQIVAIPTLLRVWPGSSRRVLGDLSDTTRVLIGLGLEAGKKALRQ